MSVQDVVLNKVRICALGEARVVTENVKGFVFNATKKTRQETLPGF